MIGPKVLAAIERGDAHPAVILTPSLEAPNSELVARCILFDDDAVTTSVLDERLATVVIDVEAEMERRSDRRCLLSCMAIHSVASTVTEIGGCSFCKTSEVSQGYRCEGCGAAVCQRCLVPVMLSRVREEGHKLTVRCPLCPMAFLKMDLPSEGARPTT